MSKSKKKVSFKLLVVSLMCLVGCLTGIFLIFYSTNPMYFERLKITYLAKPSKNLPEIGKRFQALWQIQVLKLIEDKNLLNQWGQIKEYKVKYNSKLISPWQKDLRPPIPTTSSGKYYMRVLVLSWEEEKAIGVPVAYSLFDIKTQNLVWEHAHTFYLKGNEDLVK